MSVHYIVKGEVTLVCFLAKIVEEFRPAGDDDEVYGEDNNDEAELSDDSLEKEGEGVKAASKRLSPEKEMALQTLDDVLNEAEKSMGE